MNTYGMTIRMSASMRDALDFLALMKEACDDRQICLIDIARRIQARHPVGHGLDEGGCCQTCGARSHFYLVEKLQVQWPVHGVMTEDVRVDLTGSRTRVSASFIMRGWPGDETKISALLALSEHFGDATFRFCDEGQSFEARSGFILEDVPSCA